MKKILLTIIFLIMPIFVVADDITLNSNESVTPLEYNRITEWKVTLIDPAAKRMVITYTRRLDSDVVVDNTSRRDGIKTWECRDRQQGDNAECVAVGDPWACCTGAGTGTCPEILDTCFSDVFHFTVRAQDVGTSIGSGLKQLIWNQMKQDILTGGNDGTFD